MRRAAVLAGVLALTCGFAFVAIGAGGPECGGDKTKGSCQATCGKDVFPTMMAMIGDKCFDTPDAALKAAKGTDGKVVFCVSGQKFECRDKATAALADASEAYVKRFTSIGCLVDGKVKYCDDVEACVEKAGVKATKVSTGEGSSGCAETAAKAAKVVEGACTAVKTVVAKDGGECCKSAQKAAVKTDGKECSGEAVKVAAAADGKECPHAAKTVAVADKGKECCASKAKATTVAGEACTKTDAKAVVAKAGEGSTCSGDAKAVKVAAADGCCKGDAKKATVIAAAKTDEGATCSGDKKAAKVAAGDGSCTSDAKKATVIAAAKSDDKCCQGVDIKDVKFVVLGRTFDSYGDAAKARDGALEAVKAVQMKFIVDGKEVECCSQVSEEARKAGKVQYLIGKDKTPCEITARILLSKAQYEAAGAVATKLAKL